MLPPIRPTLSLILLLLLLSTLPPPTQPQPNTLWFNDTTPTTALHQPRPTLKFGGPCVADLDSDGYPDLILSFHNDLWSRIYFGTPSSAFRRAHFRTPVFDIHGISVAPLTAHSTQRVLAVSVGGGGGGNLRPPLMYMVNRSRVITDVTYGYGLGVMGGRGRNVVFLDLGMRGVGEGIANLGGPDMLVVNFLGNAPIGPGEGELMQFGYENRRGGFVWRRVAGFEAVRRGRVEVTDVDGDGRMEVISIRRLRFFALVQPYVMRDVTARVLGGLDVGDLSVTAVAEVDFDNDGDFDLYVTRADRHLMTRLGDVSNEYSHDLLLENVGGRYVEVGKQVKVPRGSNSMGVTVGDFNNDGWVDVCVVLWSGEDVVLINRPADDGAGRRFEAVVGWIPKRNGTVGNQGVAVDWDLDGRVDLIMGQGNTHGDKKGYYLMMKNQLRLDPWTQYLLVRVRNAPQRSVTCLHAVVKVFVGGYIMTRRVGSRGAQGGGGSLIDTVHFGMGAYGKAHLVKVKWTTGEFEDRRDVASNQLITFGVP